MLVVTTKHRVLMVSMILLIFMNFILVILCYYQNNNTKKAYRKFWSYQNATLIYFMEDKFYSNKKPIEFYSSNIEKINPKDFCFFDNQKFSYDYLYKLVQKIIKQLPEINSSPNLIKLIVETAIVETNGGLFLTSTSKGGLGLTQINFKTAQFLQEKLKDTTYYIFMEKFRDKDLSLRENLIYNIGYNIAMCINYYFLLKKEDVYTQIDTLDKRAYLWKQVYNTESGIGSTEIFIKRVKSFN